MGGRSGKAKPEKRKKQRPPEPPLEFAYEEVFPPKRAVTEAVELALLRYPFLLVKRHVLPKNPLTPVALSVPSSGVEPRSLMLGNRIPNVFEKGDSWCVAAVGREGFQMTVDLRPVLP